MLEVEGICTNSVLALLKRSANPGAHPRMSPKNRNFISGSSAAAREKISMQCVREPWNFPSGTCRSTPIRGADCRSKSTSRSSPIPTPCRQNGWKDQDASLYKAVSVLNRFVPPIKSSDGTNFLSLRQTSRTGMAAESRPSRNGRSPYGKTYPIFLDSNPFSHPERGDPARSESERIVADKPYARLRRYLAHIDSVLASRWRETGDFHHTGATCALIELRASTARFSQSVTGFSTSLCIKQPARRAKQMLSAIDSNG